MLKAIFFFQTYQNLFQYWFTLLHFALDDPVLDVLWGQPIKLIQVASNSELRENQWNDLLFFEIVPSHCFGASEASKIDCLKN